MKKLILTIIIITSNCVFAQNNNLHLLLKVGQASDNDAIGSFGGGGAGLQVWDLGPIFTLGVEYDLSTSFSAQGIISYSFYQYDGGRSYGEKTSNGYNRIFDIMANVKWNLGVFYFIAGAGVSSQNWDNIRYLEETDYHSQSIFINEKSKTVVAGLWGIGFDVYISNGISLLAEGDLYLREYLGSAWLLGIKYLIQNIR